MGHLRMKESILTGSAESDKSSGNRELSEVIRRRLYWLSGRDRLLLEMVYEKGSSRRQIASLLKLPVSSLSRRIEKLTDRLLNRDYSICLLYRGQLSALQIHIARDWFVRGVSRKAIARRYRISLYRVDCHLRHLKKMIAEHLSRQTKTRTFHLREGA